MLVSGRVFFDNFHGLRSFRHVSMLEVYFSTADVSNAKRYTRDV